MTKAEEVAFRELKSIADDGVDASRIDGETSAFGRETVENHFSSVSRRVCGMAGLALS
jgi:hypothetical protein